MDDEESEDAEREGVAYLYIVFTVMCIVSTIFIYFVVPETKGKTPEDFDPVIRAHSKARTDGPSVDFARNPIQSRSASDVELSSSF